MIVMKKLQLKRTRIIGGFILIFVTMFGFFSIRSVFARDVVPTTKPDNEGIEVEVKPGDEKTEEVKPACSGYLNNIETINRYGVKVDAGEQSNTYVIKISPKGELDSSLKAALGKVKFNVTVNGASQGTVSYGSPLTVRGSFTENSESGMKEMKIVLVSTEENADPDCSGKVTITYTMENGGDPLYIDEGVGGIADIDVGSGSYTINCNNPKEGFDSDFCYAKQQAQKNPVYTSGNGILLNFTDKFNNNNKFTKVVGTDKFSKFKCDYKKVYTTEQLNGDNYYVNKSYLYGSGTRSINGGHYTYEYSPGNITKGDAAICKVKCEEAVVVEYGPPIASKAGLCFEYKIKVTSRVSCNMVEKPKTPKVGGGYCTPTPYCTDAAGTYVVNQGGPNEEFDNCIKSCDGGKYTDKCSKKCYKKVYGTSTNKKTSNVDRGYTIEKLSAPNTAVGNCAKNSSFGGCYYKVGDSVNWYGRSCSYGNYCMTGGDRFAPGRWYHQGWYPGRGSYSPSNYVVIGENGFKRHDYGSYICHDNCWWSGCSGEVYLNPGYAAKDKAKNEEIYKKTIEQCKAAASCNTSTAEFTIAVDYIHDTKDKKNETTTITFPYSTKKDKLTSKGDGAENPTNTASKADSTILSYAGCYESGSAKNWYQTEWSFPGSWINNKTGEVSYVDKSKNTAWKTMKDKFCIPLDAKDVNQKWWNYYYSKTLDLSDTSIHSEKYTEKCGPSSSLYSITKPANESQVSVDKWNITGKAVKFGYFDWNLEFKCFYALNSNPTDIKTITDESHLIEACSKPTYRIRSVDLNNMFPATDGSELQSTSQSGRTPGFNWTSYADNDKNEHFLSYPSKYMEQVQTKGYSIYGDSSLDYEFELTPEILRQMRKTTKANDSNYTEFTGESKISTKGVVNYKSTAIRSGAGLSSAKKKLPTEQGRLCNNMVNYASTQCMGYNAG